MYRNFSSSAAIAIFMILIALEICHNSETTLISAYIPPKLTPGPIPLMIKQADELIKTVPPGERLNIYQNFMDQIYESNPSFVRGVYTSPDGSTIFSGEYGPARIIDADGNVFKGNLKNIGTQFDVGQGGNIIPKYENLENIATANAPNTYEPSASAPTGQRGSPMNIPKYTNEPTTIYGRDYTGHALDEMKSEGFVPSVVENTIQKGAARMEGGEITYFDTVNKVRVSTDAASGRVTDVTSAGGFSQGRTGTTIPNPNLQSEVPGLGNDFQGNSLAEEFETLAEGGEAGVAAQGGMHEYLGAAGSGIAIGLGGIDLIKTYNDISGGDFESALVHGSGYVSNELVGFGFMAGSTTLPGVGFLGLAAGELPDIYNDISTGNWLGAAEDTNTYFSTATLGAGLLSGSELLVGVGLGGGLVGLAGFGSYELTSWALENTDTGQGIMDYIDKELIVPITGAETNTGEKDSAIMEFIDKEIIVPLIGAETNTGQRQDYTATLDLTDSRGQAPCDPSITTCEDEVNTEAAPCDPSITTCEDEVNTEAAPCDPSVTSCPGTEGTTHGPVVTGKCPENGLPAMLCEKLKNSLNNLDELFGPSTNGPK